MTPRPRAGTILLGSLLALSSAAACGGKKTKEPKPAPAPRTAAQRAEDAAIMARATPVIATPTPKLSTSIKDTLTDTARHVKSSVDGRARAAAAIDAITEKDERALGQATAVRVVEQGGGLLLTDVELLRYVNRIANAVAQQGSRKALRRDGKPRISSREFTVGILDDDASVNAFATPGGYLFVTTGLLRNLGSESELAWILGHEIAHVDLEHPLKALKLYVSQKAHGETIWHLLSGPHASQRGAWNDSKFFEAMAVRMAEISTRLHGKEEERGADVLGLRYSVAAGYDAAAPLRVLEMMGEPGKVSAAFATHDAPSVRAMNLAGEIEDAKGRDGYLGLIGASRFTHEGIERLDLAQAAARADSAGDVGAGGQRP